MLNWSVFPCRKTASSTLPSSDKDVNTVTNRSTGEREISRFNSFDHIASSTKGTRMHFSFKQMTALFMAVLFVLPANVIAGPATQAHARPKLRNVELAQGGEVQGRVLDIHGRPVADTTVQITMKAGKQEAKTNGKGQFTLTGLKGGVCAIQVGEAKYGARLWTEQDCSTEVTQTVFCRQRS
jgi:hypothetical protein